MCIHSTGDYFYERETQPKALKGIDFVYQVVEIWEKNESHGPQRKHRMYEATQAEGKSQMVLHLARGWWWGASRKEFIARSIKKNGGKSLRKGTLGFHKRKESTAMRKQSKRK